MQAIATLLILFSFAIFSLGAPPVAVLAAGVPLSQMTEEELQRHAQEHYVTRVPAELHYLTTQPEDAEEVLLLFEIDTRLWKNVYAPWLNQSVSFVPPLSIKSHLWMWRSFDLRDDGTLGDRVAGDGVFSLLLQVRKDARRWAFAIDDAGPERGPHESVLATLLKEAAGNSSIGYDGHFGFRANQSKVVAVTSAHFEEFVRNRDIEISGSVSLEEPSRRTFSKEEAARRMFFVSAASGNDDNAGTSPDQAFRSLRKGLEQLRFNDTLVVGPGRYHADMRKDPLVLESVENCWIIAHPRGKAEITGAWASALNATLAWKDEGQGIYSTDNPGHLASTGYFSDGTGKRTFLLDLRVNELKDRRIVYPEDPESPITLPGHGFAIDHSSDRLLLRLPNQVNPNGKSIFFQSKVPESLGRSILLQLRNTRNVIIDGFVFSGVNTAIRARGPNDGLVIRNNQFQNCLYGITITDSQDTIFEWNEYTFPGLDTFIEDLTAAHPGNRAIPFRIGKRHFFNEGGLERSDRVTRHRSRFNFSHGAMDGFHWHGSRDSDYHHNVIYSMLDNAFEIDSVEPGWGQNMRIHHNLILKAYFGPVSQQMPGQRDRGTARRGPIYIYRNVIAGYSGEALNSWTVVKGPSQFWELGFHLYHNSIRMHSGTLFTLSPLQTSDEAMRSLSWRNNLLIFERHYSPGTFSAKQPPEQTANNFWVSPEGFLPLMANRGVHLHSPEKVMFVSEDWGFDHRLPLAQQPFEFRLRANSPLVDNGMHLPKNIPGASYPFSGSAPDVGAFEAGAACDHENVPIDASWPRPRFTQFRETVPEGFTAPPPWP